MQYLQLRGITANFVGANNVPTSFLKMKKLFFSIFLTIAATITVSGAETYFPYPTPPEALTTLSQRTNYLVEHFWDRCNLKSAFSSRAKLAVAFRDYVSFMPYASADTVHASIMTLIENVKGNKNNLLTLAEIAESTLYGDSAEVLSDELYLPFAAAIANNKKIPAASRARFEHQARVLANSQVGAIAPALKFVTPNGEKSDLSKIESPYTLLFFNDPDCDDCALAKTRLAADYSTRQLIEKGILKIVSIYPDAPTEEWRESAAGYPTTWIVGASDEADDTFDMRNAPVMYFLEKDKKILAKNMVIDNVINAFNMINNAQTTPAQ